MKKSCKSERSNSNFELIVDMYSEANISKLPKNVYETYSLKL